MGDVLLIPPQPCPAQTAGSSVRSHRGAEQPAVPGIGVLQWLTILGSCLVILCASGALARGGLPDPIKSAATVPPPGWVQLDVHGTITAVNSRGGTFLISVPQRDRSLSRTVKVISGSVLQIKATATFFEDVSDLRVGDETRVWGYGQPDGSLLAAHVLVLSRRTLVSQRQVGVPSTRPGVYGVVLAVGEETFTVLTDTGQVKEVLWAPMARVEGAPGPAELRQFDIVRIDGKALSDGNLSATRVTVDFIGATARRLSGRITAVVPEANLFVLDDTVFVNVVPDSFLVQGTALRTVSELTVGRSVTVVGAIGTTPSVVKGRVIVLSP